MVQKKLYPDLTQIPKPTKYVRDKLSAEEVTVMKKALSVFETRELENERLMLLAKLMHNDYFVCIYTSTKK